MKKMMVLLAVTLLVSSLAVADTIGMYSFEHGADGSGSTGTAPTTSGWVLDTAGTLNGTASTASGLPAYVDSSLNGGNLGMEFGAKLSGVQLNNNAKLQFSENTAQTFEFFVRRDGDGPDGSAAEWIISKDYANSSNKGWGFYFLRTDGTIILNIAGNTVASTTDFRDGEVHHVAVTHAADSGTYTLYVDYQQENQLSWSSGSVSSGAMMLGKGYGWQDSRVFDGMLDEFRISDVALSPSEFIQVPEPATMCIIGLGLAGTLLRRKK